MPAPPHPSSAAPAASPRSVRLALWGLMLGNLVIGTGFMLPAGMLHLLAPAFSVSVPRAGALIWAGGLTLAVGAPLMAWLASGADRRRLLVVALAIYVVGHAASALVTDYDAMLGLRLATLIGAAIFTPQAAATVGLMLPPERRAAGVTFVFLGWPISSVVGMPLGSWVGALAGWATPFWAVAVASALVLALLATSLPRGLRTAPVSLQTWLVVGRDRVLPVLLLLTTLQMTGVFTVFTFLAPELTRRLDAGPALLAGLLAWFGVCSMAGSLVANHVAGRVAGYAGLGRVAQVTLGLVTCGMLLMAVSPPVVALYVASLLLWGLGGFATQSMQQARLVTARPALAPATVALNSSALYFGQAAGGVIGAWLIASGHPEAMPWVGAATMAVAMATSRLADRRMA